MAPDSSPFGLPPSLAQHYARLLCGNTDIDSVQIVQTIWRSYAALAQGRPDPIPLRPGTHVVLDDHGIGTLTPAKVIELLSHVSGQDLDQDDESLAATKIWDDKYDRAPHY